MYSRYRMTEARLGTDRLPGSVHRPITRRRQRCCCLRDFRDGYSSVIYSTCWSAARHSGDGKRGRRKQCLKTVLLLFLRTVRHFGVSSMSTAWGGVSVAVHLIVCVGCWTFCYFASSPPGRFAPLDVTVPGRFATSMDVSPSVSKLVICDTVTT